ncbi:MULTISPECIES: 3-oxoacyl-ACP reductase family protein [unclassified Beijerinckia]|uniref:3-oxoacyl-ACP reductase family protein n=1 Tax=unclassified Beijerinckia TaxID=2638183 RepID=UPI0008992BF0|nr:MULTISPECIES: 3-oxoacyl-ACP reductase family protein [unclassified Beijerinckia]MDH7793940.1 3-oxoacyl-[acyl-carrier protein] reductase [Beijerinckia sp. GAS462]SEB49870.1 NAD(P)-dependent dehydrogenase, short-chain alcohol dehydrogenase family [Beijerinckia sp. 28-YEA-48]
MLPLQDKVALVTGGSRGMGAAIAERLARDGADVAFTYVRAADKGRATLAKIEAEGRHGLALAADGADPAAVQAAVDQTFATFGRLDILINNAGIFVAKPIDALTLDDYDQTLAVNVKSVFVAAQAAAKHMTEGGRIITIGSNLADRVPGAGLSLYSLSKAALIGLTKGLARDLGSRGITANIVQPGSTDTDMNPADGAQADAQRGLMAIPRFGEAHDIASIVAWIASSQSRFATGTAFTLDGGANI